MAIAAKSSKRQYGDGTTYFSTTKNRYIAAVVIGHKADGSPIKKSKTCRSQKEAQRALKELNAKLLENKLVSNDRFYVSSLFEDWKEYGINPGIREATKNDYIVISKNYVLPYLGKKRLIDVGTTEIDKWLYSLRQAGFSSTTCRKARQNANMIFKYAVKKRLILFNPVTDSNVPKRDKNSKTLVRKPLSIDEWKDYLDAFLTTELDTFVHLAELLGLRRGEIIGLDWEDIDFEKCTLFVRKSAREVTTYRPDGSSKTNLVNYDPKTKHSKRILHLEPVLIDALKRQKIRQAKQKLLAGDAWQETGAVFTTGRGTRIYPSNIYKKYRKIIEIEELRYVRIHDLRHTVATLLMEQSQPIEEVSRLLGHSSINVTVDIYGSTVQALADRGAKGMSQLYTSVYAKKTRFKGVESR